MVFEDDVTFPGRLFKEALFFMRHLPAEWDVLRFDCEGVFLADPTFYDVIAPGVYRVHWGDPNHCTANPHLRCWLCGGAYAVVYQHRALPTVLQVIHDHTENIDIDCLLTSAGQPNGPLHSYCIQLGLVDPWSGFTSDRLGF
eukprot:GGOE01002075.1.p1 GENE.GGOE01002075.1~~GGOE01002075.1.p1  ORF type:complete len:142 (+),score=19.57 GGOE01002075.1:2-427(+)